MRSARRPLALFALAVVLGHHVGTLVGPFGTVGATEWADWVDLFVPLAVLAPAAVVLDRLRAARRTWLVAGAGTLAYVQGHSLHLAANSVSNAGPAGRAASAAHLWDEVVSHYVWYAGLAVVVAALAAALLTGEPGEPAAERPGAAATVFAVLFGFTVATNGIEGATPALTLVTAAVFVVWGWRRRDRVAGRLLLRAYGLTLVLLLAWGAWHRGFPEFSELGWI